jgi:hypothetical protein
MKGMDPGIFPPEVLARFEQVTLPSENSLWLLFAVIVFLYSIFSFILSYHWRTYAFDRDKIQLIMRLYFSVSLILLGGMAVFLFAYQP